MPQPPPPGEKAPSYPPNEKLCVPYSQCGCSGDKKDITPLPGVELWISQSRASSIYWLSCWTPVLGHTLTQLLLQVATHQCVSVTPSGTSLCARHTAAVLHKTSHLTVCRSVTLFMAVPAVTVAAMLAMVIMVTLFTILYYGHLPLTRNSVCQLCCSDWSNIQKCRLGIRSTSKVIRIYTVHILCNNHITYI